jgi:hypothetical protein
LKREGWLVEVKVTLSIDEDVRINSEIASFVSDGVERAMERRLIPFSSTDSR